MTVRDRLRAARYRAFRSVLALRRPSPGRNARALRERREPLDALVVREPAAADVPALAALHVAAWDDAYYPLLTGPSVAVRERQWREAFARPAGWFGLVVARPDGSLVGFAKGVFRPGHDIPGELNKLFLARAWQRVGLGRRLLGRVAERFTAAGVRSMAAYVDPRNPSCGFFERMGARRIIERGGRVNFSWYVWADLASLARRCAPSP